MDRHHGRDRPAGRSARLWYAIFKPETYPSMADLGLHRASTCCCTSASSCCSARVRARSAGTLWLDGITAASPPPRSAPRSSSSSSSRAPKARRRPSSRTSRTRSATFFCSLPSSASSRSPAGGPGRRWLLLGLGVLSTALADIVYLFQSAEGTYVEGTWIDILWPTALLLIASSAWMPDRTREGSRGGRSTAARRPGGLRARRDRNPRLRPLHLASTCSRSSSRRPRSCSSSCGSRSRSGRTAVSSS